MVFIPVLLFTALVLMQEIPIFTTLKVGERVVNVDLQLCLMAFWIPVYIGIDFLTGVNFLTIFKRISVLISKN